jgi:hypothetical protein
MLWSLEFGGELLVEHHSSKSLSTLQNATLETAKECTIPRFSSITIGGAARSLCNIGGDFQPYEV